MFASMSYPPFATCAALVSVRARTRSAWAHALDQALGGGDEVLAAEPARRTAAAASSWPSSSCDLDVMCLSDRADFLELRDPAAGDGVRLDDLCSTGGYESEEIIDAVETFTARDWETQLCVQGCHVLGLC